MPTSPPSDPGPAGPPLPSAEAARMAEAGGMVYGPEDAGPWYQWGPYLSERAWGTVREDYSADGDAWDYLPYDHARSHAYRWNEDGIAGVSDLHQDMCLALALWNGRDDHLKERFFGLTNGQGNHGEDVKEYWWYLDATPSHAWLRTRYHYPQAAFPYEDLVRTNASRGKHDPEYELLDTGVFDEDRYWVVEVSYAKNDPSDLHMRVRVTNAGPDRDTLHVLPTLWFRDTWNWSHGHPMPEVIHDSGTIIADHHRAGRWHFDAAAGPDGSAPVPLFCDNATNATRLFGPDAPVRSPYPKDGINDHVVHGADTVNPEERGTKAAYWYRVTVDPGETVEVRLRLWSPEEGDHPQPGWEGRPFDALMSLREKESDEFYAALAPHVDDEQRAVMRQAFAGMIWGKQFYRNDVRQWLFGDPGEPPPPAQRRAGRNAAWKHLDAADVISMPDAWEYPWFASWDLSFHTVVLAHVDPEYAKYQMLLLLREWYMHPNGAIPAYEWNFGDVNPPVQAWAAIRIFEIDGGRDLKFLAQVFQKLLMNFTWWVNRQDAEGNNVFEGGFLGLDNIGPIDRSHLPPGYEIEQADGTAWMAFYALSMLRMALRLAQHDGAYSPMVLKFLEHFAAITDGMSDVEMFDPDDGFFYDQLTLPNGERVPLKVRSLVGVIPVLAAAYLEGAGAAQDAERYQRRFASFMRRRMRDPEHQEGEHTGFVQMRGAEGRREALLTVADPERLRRLLVEVLSEDSLLGPTGLRSMSRRLRADPYSVTVEGRTFTVDYEPAESTTGMYGGNSNWRGPVWFPINHLVVEALERYHMYLGDDFQVECPTGSGQMMNLLEVAHELRRRLISTFLRDADGRRPVFGGSERFQSDPRWNDAVLFYEYFNGDDGAGLGASHQTGWTGLVADLIIGRKG
ncbi:MAG: hypothetical protein R2737_07145 [Candidatus Nanopelagicales bacterium]